ncbi:pentapeptide repeat-containing protein [Streptomyces vinaceus]
MSVRRLLNRSQFREIVQQKRRLARHRTSRSFYVESATSLKPKRVIEKRQVRIAAVALTIATWLIFGVIATVPYIPQSVREVFWPNLSGLTPEASVAARGQFRLAVVQAFVATGASVALLYTARNYALTRRGQVTDRFTKALERLSSEHVYVRIGAIAAMKQILLDAPDQAEDAARVLEAFIHERTARLDDDKGAEIPSPDVAFAIEALGKAIPRGFHIVRLSDRDLRGVRLRGMTLYYAMFDGSILRLADLRFSDMRQASMRGVDATGTEFSHASLGRANLIGADLSVCQLDFTNLSSAKMTGVNLTGAQAEGAIFSDAILVRAKISGTFTGCDFRRADLTNADLALLNAPKSDFQGARLRGANLAAADLSSALGLTADQVLEARISGSTLLPDYLNGDERVVLAVNGNLL